jgi:hypothetical protein
VEPDRSTVELSEIVQNNLINFSFQLAIGANSLFASLEKMHVLDGDGRTKLLQNPHVVKAIGNWKPNNFSDHRNNRREHLQFLPHFQKYKPGLQNPC